MSRQPSSSPPAGAIRLLGSGLPPIDRDAVLGDMLEVFANRVDAGRHFNRIWFWAQTMLFLGVAMAQRYAPHSSGSHFMGIGHSLRQSARRLRHEWRYAAAVILILGIGIGPAAAMLSVVNKILLRPLAYRDPDQIALLRIDLGALSGHPGLSPAEVIDLRKSGIFDAVEAETRLSEVSYGPPEHLVAFRQINVTTGMLQMLGVSPVIGRNFTDDDIPQRPAPPRPGARPGPAAPRVQRILLDYAAWQQYFGGDRSVIGRVIQINGGPSEIIGVLPDNFRLATGRSAPQRVDIYGAIALYDFRNAWQLPTLARLKAGSTFAEVQAGLDVLAPTLKKQYPQSYDGRLRFTARPVLDDITKDSRPALGAATGAVLLLLVIAFANATALVVARLKGREMDLAIRAAMGASRAQLVVDVLAEATVLAAGGMVLGALFAVAAVAGIRAVMPRTVPRWEEIAVGWDVLLYAVGLALAGLFASGLIPLWRNAHGSTVQTLRAGSVQGGKAEGTLSRLLLVGSQIALTVVLAFGCLQLVRSASALGRVNLGYDPDVLTLQVPLDFQMYGSPEARAGLYQRIRDRVKLVPGVTSVGVVTHIPLSGSTMMDGYQADLSKEPSFDQSANYQAVTPGYFETMKIPILQGRDFTDQEDLQHQNVIVVDETLVRTVFPGETNVIGRTLRLGWELPNAQIVGVVGHARTIEVGRAVRPQIYAPMGNLFQSVGIVVVRASGDALALAPAIGRAIDEVGPNRAVTNVAMLSNNVKAATSALVAVTELVTFLAISAGVLSAAGLYLVIAYVVHQRRQATAIRAALGASRSRVIWEHGRTSAKVMLLAVPAGAGLALVIAPMLGTLVYGVSPRDPASLVVAIGAAVLAGIAGTCVPVLRAANANIVAILRGD